ncbi:DUF3427 domain-containing protein [Paenibacillus sp. BGI2013]|uniref:HNH endonuclease n=1 Tax=Paenibacillus TaxID=44249 RepID=UPI0009F9084D|nr:MULTISPECIES: DUF3427 domain-containing protein [Paenibacillus]PKQ90407.1 DUF3427 domain-containing protein [Paenibacillus sp. BGI2013]
MIPQNIVKQNILDAIAVIHKEGVPKERESTKYHLRYNGGLYPPKYVISVANRFANGHALSRDRFNGGAETNNFLKRLGFEVIEETLATKNEMQMSEEQTFRVGEYYSRNDIYQKLNVPKAKQKGHWNTGYTQYEKDSFIFANVGTAGRTGHDHPNRFDGNDLIWYGRNKSTLTQSSIQSLINPEGRTYIFAREDSNDPKFLFLGNGRAKDYFDESPVKIIWSFDNETENHPEILAEEVNELEIYTEGSVKKVSVNVYERNPIARKKCIEHYGLGCQVCGFNFVNIYGIIGENFIHVHHLKPLHEISEKYEIDPVEDLRPICPNCHAMLHKRKPAYSIEELKRIIKDKVTDTPH